MNLVGFGFVSFTIGFGFEFGVVLVSAGLVFRSVVGFRLFLFSFFVFLFFRGWFLLGSGSVFNLAELRFILVFGLIFVCFFV